jgi:poly(3-hydroxybutyrate) depolymerase
MFNRMKFCLFILIALAINAQTINLRGKVTNMAGKPIANAIVTLLNQGLKDTSGTDGAYSIMSGTPVVSPISLIPRFQTIVLEKGVLEFSLPDPSPVKVEIFDVKGNLLKRELLQNASKGFYRFNIEENSHGAKLLIVRTSIGKDIITFRYLPLKGLYLISQSNERSQPVGGKLAKLTAISDSLKVTAASFNPKTVAIASYDQEMNISLDSANAKRSSGCGKTAPFKGEIITTINTGGKNREYIVRLPDDYDPNTPYKLWFGLHCSGGRDTGVAKGSTIARGGSANTNYEYYGIWKFANPTGGKGTTIFCAPQGIGNQWGQGAADVQFIRALIQKFESELCIDESRIFSEGFSMGGSMSYALACAMPDTIRAICMHSGGNMSGCDGAHRGPVPIFITHGTDDGTCRWPDFGWPQFQDLATRDGCTVPNIPSLAKPTDQTHPVNFDLTGCKTGYPCKACIFKGGHDPSPGNDPPGTTWGELTTWVDDSTWNYFKQFY